MAKLSNNDRLEIRRQYGTGLYSYGDLAKVYHVTRQAISDVVHGRYLPPQGNPKAGKKATKKGQELDSFTEIDTAPTQALGQVRKPGIAKAEALALQDGSTAQAQAIMQELDNLLVQQLEGLQELQAQEASYKATLMDEAALKDKLTMQAFKLQGHTKYSALPAQGKAVVDALLPKYRFDELWLVHNKMAMSLLGVKDTLSRMANLQKSMVMYFDMSTSTTIVIEAKVEQALGMLLREVVFPVLGDKLPKSLVQPLVNAMDMQYNAKKHLFEQLVNEGEQKEGGK